jgi:predicted membrane protein
MEDNFQKDDEGYGDSSVFIGRRRRRNRSHASRLFFATALIILGTLLFLGNLGLWPVHDVWQYWPIILIAVGIARLLGGRRPSSRVLGILLIFFGALFLTLTLGIFHIAAQDNSWPLSLLLIAFGFIALMRVLESGRSHKPALGFPTEFRAPSEHVVHDHAVFAEIKRKMETPDFQGGDILSVFGNIDLDLRRAQIAPLQKSATIEANAVFGGVMIRVPGTWRVNIQGTPVLGGYTDKTTPRTTPEADTPVLFITGNVVFGSIEIVD